MSRIAISVLALLLANSFPYLALAAPPHAPEWVLTAAQLPHVEKLTAAPAVVLSRDTTSKVDRDGSVTRTQRISIQVLTNSGRAWAAIAVPYLQGSSRVRTSSAWLIRNGIAVKRSERADWMDVTNDTYGALYSDSRGKALSFVAEAVIGDVFVAETQTSGETLFAEDIHSWGVQGLPVGVETYRLELPAGFTFATHVRGGPPPARQQSKDRRTTTWTLENVPFLPHEPAAPDYQSVRPMLLVRFEPPKDVRFKPLVIRSWSDLSQWTHSLNSAQCDRDEHLIAFAQSLVAASTSDLEKIRALGKFVRSLHYATLLKGLGDGLGYQPHKATQVLAQRYGDCKDKANLLCALLREVGIEADIAAARPDDGIQAEPSFPSALMFNHAIVAIRVSAAINLPSVVNTPEGRVLFFDPTAESTLVGDLPFHLQNTLVFIQRTGNDALTRLPTISLEEGHRLTRRAKLALKRNGGCEGDIFVKGIGQPGAAFRSALLQTSTKELLSELARQQLSETFRAADLNSIDQSDDELTGSCGVSFHLSKSGCLQPLTNSLYVLRAEVFGRSNLPGLTASDRKLPVQLQSLVLDDEIEFALPTEMQLHEVPTKVILASAYGTYSREYVATSTTVRLLRRLEVTAGIVPVNEYADLRKFLADLGKADRSSVILRRTDEPDVEPGA